jgi:hypothetical protein
MHGLRSIVKKRIVAGHMLGQYQDATAEVNQTGLVAATDLIVTAWVYAQHDGDRGFLQGFVNNALVALAP